MQNFKTLQQPLIGELAMSPEERGGEKNAIYSGHLRLCQQPRAAPRTPLGPILFACNPKQELNLDRPLE